MGKKALAGTSLVAAVPAGILFTIVLLAALKSISSMPTVVMAAAITVMVVALVMALFPAYVLVYYRPPAPASPAAPESDVDQELLDEDEAGESVVADEYADEGFEDADEVAVSDESEEFEEFGGGLSGDELDDTFGEASFDEEFEFDDFEDDDK